MPSIRFGGNASDRFPANAAVVRLPAPGVGKLPGLISLSNKLDQFRDVLGTLKRCKVCAEVLEQLPDAGFGFVAFHDEGVDEFPAQRLGGLEPITARNELYRGRTDLGAQFLIAPDRDRCLQADQREGFDKDLEGCWIEFPTPGTDLDVGDCDLLDLARFLITMGCWRPTLRFTASIPHSQLFCHDYSIQPADGWPP